jgi:hypothetical protein
VVLRGGVNALPAQMSSFVSNSTSPTRVVVDSTAPPCPLAVVSAVLCLELVASHECVLLLEIDTVAHDKRGTVHKA